MRRQATKIVDCVVVAIALFASAIAAPPLGQAPDSAADTPPAAVKPFTPPPSRPVPDPVLIPPPPLEDVLRVTNPNTSPTVYDQTLRLLGRTREGLPAPPAATLIRAIVGFVAFVVLAYLAGSRRVRQFERAFNIAHLMTTGLPFVLIGLIASRPEVGILTQAVLREIGPLLPLGLGWIGFVIGSRLDGRWLNELPKGTATAVAVIAGLPFAAIVGSMVFTLWVMRTQEVTTGALRDAILLGTAGAMTARSAPAFLRILLAKGVTTDRLIRIAELEQLAGVFGLAMVSASYRPPSALVAWILPGTAWLFMTLGLGTAMGIVIYVTLSRIDKDPQFTAALLGSVAFTAGMASFLRVSPLSVCFIAGAILINLGGEWRQRAREVFQRLERPIYFLFMVIAGALWHPWEWQGWALMAIFVMARLLSKWLSSKVVGRWVLHDLTKGEQRALTLGPMGALSVAIVVSAQDLYSGPTVAWIVTAVVGGSLIMEATLQLALKKLRKRSPDEASGAVTPAEPAHAEVD